MNISSVLRDHGVGTGIKPEGTAVPADVLSGKSFINKDGKQIGGMPYRTGNVTGKSISRSGTTLRIKPQTGYVDDTTNVQWSDPNWIAGNIRQGVSIFGLTGSLVLGSPFANGITTPSGYAIEIRGLTFRPRILVVGAANSNDRVRSFGVFVGSEAYSAGANRGEIGMYVDVYGTAESATYTIYQDGFRAPVNTSGTAFWIAVG